MVWQPVVLGAVLGIRTPPPYRSVHSAGSPTEMDFVGLLSPMGALVMGSGTASNHASVLLSVTRECQARSPQARGRTAVTVLRY